jgi:hypothetical protein
MLNPPQMVRPLILIIVCEDSQHLADGPICPFYLAVGVLMEGRRHQ